MNFLEKLKEQFVDLRNSAGMRRRITVDAEALFTLIEDYERLDAHARGRYDQESPGLYSPEESTRIAITNLYHQSRQDPFKVVRLVVDTLSNLHRVHEKFDAAAAKIWRGDLS